MPVEFVQSGSVAILRLNRPEKMNSFNRQMALRMQDLLDQCQQDHSIRAVVITGAGKAFSAGQDLSEVTDAEGPGMQRILSEHYNPIIRKIRALRKPVLAAVNGVAAGAGANIALCCDIVVASQNASFIQAFSKIGLIPDSGGTFFLPRLIGWQRASAIMMLGDKIPAEDALTMGMIYRTYPADSFEQDVLSLAQQLAAMPTAGLAYTKEALNASMNHSLGEQLELEDGLQQAAAATQDFSEGVQAFLQKRSPRFEGK